MENEYQIEITQRHLDDAQEWWNNHDGIGVITNCPVARALKEQFPGQSVVVGFTTATVGNRNWELSDNAKKYTHSYQWIACKPEVITLSNPV